MSVLSTARMSLDERIFSLITHSPDSLNYTMATERIPMDRNIPLISGAVTFPPSLPPSSVLTYNPFSRLFVSVQNNSCRFLMTVSNQS